MLLFLIALFLGLGSSFFGVSFAKNALTVATGAAKKVVATKIFLGLCVAMTLALALPLAGALISLSLGNVRSAQAIILVSFMFSVAVFATIKLAAGFFIGVVEIAYSRWPVQDIGEGIKYFALGMIMWDLFIMVVLLSLGVHAYSEGIIALLVGGLLYWSVSEYYGIPTAWFPKLAMGIAYVLMGWFVAGSIPGTLWLAVGLSNLRPTINFWSTFESADLDADERVRQEFIKLACSRMTASIRQQYGASGSFAEAKRPSKALREIEKACAKGDTETLQTLEATYSPWHVNKAACLDEVAKLRNELAFAPNVAEAKRINERLTAKMAQCPTSQ